MRAVEDGEKIYFAFRWEDPTRSQMRLPLQKREDGWHMLGTKADIADVVDYYEDKLAILFTNSDAFGNGGTTHMGPDPLPGAPKPVHGRGYHYTTDGLYADVWQWKASRGGLLGRVDDMCFGPPKAAERGDEGRKGALPGRLRQRSGQGLLRLQLQGRGSGRLSRPRSGSSSCPRTVAATTSAMGTLHLILNSSNDEGSRWWMTEGEVVPYSKEADDKIPVGTVIPGVLIQGAYEGDRADIVGSAVWRDGYWTLETSRKLKTGNPYDVAFGKDERLFMYVSVFDHTQTRHTRHMRPIVLSMSR